MSNASITLPDDAANTGKNRQTVERVVDGATVHATVDLIGDWVFGSNIARVMTAAPGTAEAGLVVWIAHAAGVHALNVQDGGNSLTVDNGGTFAVQATQSGTWNVTNISGTVSLPTGAATEATLSALNTKVTAVDTGAVVLAAGSAAIGSLADTTASGTITVLDGTVQIENPGGAGTWVLELTGTWTATVSFERSISGAVGTWVAAGTPGGFTTAVANSTFRGEISGYRYFRARASAYTSGTIGVSLRLTPALLTLSLGTGANAIGKLAANTAATYIGDVVLQAGSAAFGKLAANDGIDIGDATINNAAGASAVNIQDGGNSITVDGTVTITPPTLTKGTQGATGLSVQALKDAGRTTLTYLMAAPVTLTTSDVAQSMVGYSNGASIGAATATATSAIGAGKTWRLTGVSIEYSGSNTAGGALVTLRANTAGAAVVGSPAIGAWLIGSGVGGFCAMTVPLPDGIELPAGSSIVISAQGRGTNNAAAALGYVLVGITSFAY